MVSQGKNNDLPDKDKLRKYLQGKLPSDEAHRIEKLILNNPLYQEALDGLETLSEKELEQDLKDLSQKISQKAHSTSKGTAFNFYRVAAAIILLAVFSYVIVYTTSRMGDVSKNETLSQRKEVPAEKDENPAEALEEEESDTVFKSAKPDNPEIRKSETDMETREQSDEAIILSETSKSESDKSLEESIDVATQEESPEVLTVIVSEETLKEPTEDEVEDSDFQDMEEDQYLVDQTQDLEIKEEISAVAVTDEEKSIDIGNNQLENSSFEQEAESPKISEEPTEALSDSHDATRSKRKENRLARQSDGQSVEIARTAAQPSPYSELTTDEIPTSVPVIGYENFAEYISKNLNYPAEELEKKIEGAVKLKFFINKDSIPDKIRIIQSLSPDCDKEAKRLLTEGPKWIPVYIDGALNETEQEYSIFFKVEE